MELTRRDWQLVLDRLGKLESKVYQLEAQMRTMENSMKPENLVRRLKQAEEDADAKAREIAKKEELLRTNI